MKNIKNVLNRVKKESPKLYWIVIFHLLVAISCIIGLFVDDRALMGVNVWIKPLKLAISGAVFILTIGYLTTVYPYSKLKKNIVNNLVSWTLLGEILIIVFQAFRGVQSHYNISTPLDGILFGLMGILISVSVLIMVLFVIDTVRLKFDIAPSVRWALLLGWLVVLFGSWVGGQMIGQLAHNVGVADGGAGLPLLNWSTIAGDLRVAHFFGLHGIQIIPLFAIWLSKNGKLNSKRQLIAVIVFGLLYALWIGFTFYQAKQGLALIRL